MCKDCGCEEKTNNQVHLDHHEELDHEHCTHHHEVLPAKSAFRIEKSVTDFNDTLASHIAMNLKALGILCINVMGAPGSGKTTVIEGIAQHISPAEICVIQGDLESDIDKKRLEKIKISTHQINTHSGCHLNAAMMNKALLELAMQGKKYLIIENVGNLVCPAGVKIGQHMNVIVSSTTEGSDKPKKYPYIFMDCDLIILSKSDLASAAEFDEEQYFHDIHHINSHANIIKTTKKDPAAFKQIAHVLEHERAHLLQEHHHHEELSHT
jgi:hydrogenase nickel incorporation protein HypB